MNGENLLVLAVLLAVAAVGFCAGVMAVLFLARALDRAREEDELHRDDIETVTKLLYPPARGPMNIIFSKEFKDKEDEQIP